MRLKSVNIQGYRPFKNFQAPLQPLEIIVGANGAGKSSLFEFLKFLRDSLYYDIPPEIISGSIGQQIFHIPGPAKFEWNIEIDTSLPIGMRYLGELMGPVGRTQVSYERVESSKPFGNTHKTPYIYMDIQGNKGVVQDPKTKKFTKQEIALKRPNQLALSTMTNPSLEALYDLREYIREWRFYSSFNIANQKIRQSVPIEQEPILHEDAGNLSSV
ncbi:MAG: AAA family ATPase, partial [Dolichospermum sp.]